MNKVLMRVLGIVLGMCFVLILFNLFWVVIESFVYETFWDSVTVFLLFAVPLSPLIAVCFAPRHSGNIWNQMDEERKEGLFRTLMFFLGNFLLYFFWSDIVTGLFPRAVQEGYITKTITIGLAFKIYLFLFVVWKLFKMLTRPFEKAPNPIASKIQNSHNNKGCI